jgi:hypothetical protein
LRNIENLLMQKQLLCQWCYRCVSHVVATGYVVLQKEYLMPCWLQKCVKAMIGYKYVSN